MRLVVGSYSSARPRLPQLRTHLVFWEPAHRVMQTRQLATLKRRAERQPVQGGDGELVEQGGGRP